MQTNKKVLITFIFALIFACFNISQVKAEECKPLDAVVTGVEDFKDGSTKFLISANGVMPNLYDATLILDDSGNRFGYKASFKVSQKPDQNPPYNLKLEFFIPATYDRSKFKPLISITPNTCGEPVKQLKTCFAYYEFKFFCPEDIQNIPNQQKTRQGVDIVLVVDSSETASKIINNMKTAVSAVLSKNDLNESIDNVGLVSFGGIARDIVRLENQDSIEATKKAINNWQAAANTTNLASGILKASGLFKSSLNKNNKKIIIVVSDGIVNNSTITSLVNIGGRNVNSTECSDKESYPITANKCTNDTLAKARLAQSQGIKIYSVFYGYTNAESKRKGSGAMAQSVMRNIASCPTCFVDDATKMQPYDQSKELANLRSILTKIIGEQIYNYSIQQAYSRCSNVNVRFNFNSLIAQNFKFYSGQSSAYRGVDQRSIGWNFGNINTDTGTSYFYVSADNNQDKDFEDILKQYGMGSFVVNYKNAKGEQKEINFSHSDILDHMMTQPNVDSYIGETYFGARFVNAGCGKVPEIKVIDIEKDNQKGEYIIKRIPYADECGKVRIDISITCSHSNGCKAISFIDNFPEAMKYEKNDQEQIESCITPEAESQIVGKYIACTIPESNKEAQDKKIYYLKANRSGNQPTNDINKYAYYMASTNEYKFFDAGNVDVTKCQNEKGEYTVKRSVEAGECSLVKVTLDIECNDTKGCTSLVFKDNLPNIPIINIYEAKLPGNNNLSLVVDKTKKVLQFTAQESFGINSMKYNYFVKILAYSGSYATNDISKPAYINFSGKNIYFDEGRITMNQWNTRCPYLYCNENLQCAGTPKNYFSIDDCKKELGGKCYDNTQNCMENCGYVSYYCPLHSMHKGDSISGIGSGCRYYSTSKTTIENCESQGHVCGATQEICENKLKNSGRACGKPVVYLYPTKTQKVKVQLDFKGNFVSTYPEYDNKIKGWEVIAKPNGELVNIKDGLEYSYLFWDGKSTHFDPDLSKGYVVRGEDTLKFLQDQLAKRGLTPKEYNEMIVYWLPWMKHHKYNLISFVDKEYTDIAKMNITPKPDSILRLMMVFKELKEPISIEPQTIKPFVRKGFVVVEWGGAELDGDWRLE